MSYHPRIETAKFGSFLTTRSRNSELWFINNRPLEKAILGYAAKYAQVHEVKLYALAIEGNHIQGTADFPLCNRAHFMRDFNSMTARAVPRYVPTYPGGSFWARRYSSEILPADEDIERQFFYTVLQPVQDGLAERISDYDGYNCFHDAIWGITRTYKVVRWGEYHAKRRYNKNISIADFTDVFKLKYERLPGYEHLSQKEYAHLMQKKLELIRQEIVAERRKAGLGFATKEQLRKIRPGAKPRKTKTSTRESHRPRVLCSCDWLRQQTLEWYFGLYAWYKDASRQYRSGRLDVEFPEGMYKPPPIMLATR